MISLIGYTVIRRQILKKNSKNKKKSKFSRTIGIIIKIIIALLLLIAIIGGTLLYFKYGDKILKMSKEAKEVVEKSNFDTFRQTETGVIYDANGMIMSKLKGEKDVYYIKYREIPKSAVDAITSIEDKNFFRHKGYDIKAILRAAVAYVKNKGAIRQGGSTITQQLARNIFLNFEATWQRKAREIFIARELEKKYSKQELMEFYLNNIYFANGFYGIQSASLGYFGKGVNSLSLSQIAFILSIPNSPTRYNPYENIKGTLARRDRILDQMVLDGKLDKQVADKAKKEKIKLKEIKKQKSSYTLTFAMDCAVRSLMKADGFQFRYDFSSSEDKKDYEETYSKEYATCQNRLYSGGYRVYTSLDPEKQKLLQDTIDNGLSVSTEKSKDGVYKLQSSAVTIDNDTGRVVAIVGGRSQNFKGVTLNRAYQSYRQPGSSIKPIAVYTPAFEKGYRPESIVKDERIKGGPGNADGMYNGNMTILNAVAISKNTIAWRLFTELSPAYCIGKLLDMEFTGIEDTDYYPAASLGGLTKGVSTLEMASAYATLENSGEFREPTCIMKMTDSEGNDVVVDGFYSEAVAKKIYSDEACKMMLTCMDAVMKQGTGKFARISQPCYGKTGTTNNDNDYWFVGFTKYYTTSVWVGYDIPQSLRGLNWKATPMNIWKTYMEKIHEGLEKIKLDAYKLPISEPEEDEKDDKENEESDNEDTEEKPAENEKPDTDEDQNSSKKSQKTGKSGKSRNEDIEDDDGENPEEDVENPEKDTNTGESGNNENENAPKENNEGTTENNEPPKRIENATDSDGNID